MPLVADRIWTVALTTAFLLLMAVVTLPSLWVGWAWSRILVGLFVGGALVFADDEEAVDRDFEPLGDAARVWLVLGTSATFWALPIGWGLMDGLLEPLAVAWMTVLPLVLAWIGLIPHPQARLRFRRPGWAVLTLAALAALPGALWWLG